MNLLFILIGLFTTLSSAYDIKTNCSLPNQEGSFCYNGPKMDAYGQVKSCNVPGTFALTFDDGPSENTIPILNILDKYNMKATFFLIGSKLDSYPDIAQEIINRGHQIGIHTYSHFFLTNVSLSFVKQEVILNERAIINKNFKGALSKNTIPKYFRAPHGVVDDAIMQLLTWDLGYKVIHWSFLTGDSRNNTDAEGIYDIYTSHLGGEKSIGVVPNKLGVISQQHDTVPQTFASFDRVASYLNRTLASQGTKFVTIAECMGDVPYRTNPRPTNDPTCSNGILSVSKRTCCATSCGKCGGTGCGNFLGSANNCCEDTIRTFKYTQNCNSSIAPCIMK